MAYRNKVYVCFDADSDIHYYRLMQGWKASKHIDFDFHDAHDLNNLRDGNSDETIKRKLRERLNNAKILIVLIGLKTKNLYRFVRWEQEVALDLNIPIVAVNLNKNKTLDSQLCPRIIREELVLHIPYRLSTIKWSIENWPGLHEKHFKKQDIAPKQITADLLEKLLAK